MMAYLIRADAFVRGALWLDPGEGSNDKERRYASDEER